MKKCTIKHKASCQQFKFEGDGALDAAEQIFDVLSADDVPIYYHVLYGENGKLDIEISKASIGEKRKGPLDKKHIDNIKQKILQKNFVIGDQDE